MDGKQIGKYDSEYLIIKIHKCLQWKLSTPYYTRTVHHCLVRRLEARCKVYGNP